MPAGVKEHVHCLVDLGRFCTHFQDPLENYDLLLSHLEGQRCPDCYARFPLYKTCTCRHRQGDQAYNVFHSCEPRTQSVGAMSSGMSWPMMRLLHRDLTSDEYRIARNMCHPHIHVRPEPINSGHTGRGAAQHRSLTQKHVVTQRHARAQRGLLITYVGT